jgi:hypothetical protein
MKKVVLMFALMLSASSFAQDNQLSTRASKPASPSPLGIYVGADYMNLTDVHAQRTAKTPYGTYSDHAEYGAQLGMAGITVGYDRTPDSGIGFKAGLRLLESFNRSEYGDDKLQMIIPEVNLTLAATNWLVGYAGANAAVWTGSSAAYKFKTQIGGQAGLGLRFTKNIGLNAGYTIMSEKISESNFGTETDLDLQISGFNTNLTYMF